MFRRIRLLTLTALMTVVLGSSVAQADLVMPGQKKVRRDTTIDFGQYQELAPWSYKVIEGDTLTALAQKYLGSAARHKQIVELNDALKSGKLLAGVTILMPPKSADSSKWMHFFAVAWGSSVKRAFHGEKLHHHHYWTQLWAVPHANVSAFLEGMNVDRRQNRDLIQERSKESYVAIAEEKLCGYVSMSDGSAIKTIHETYTVNKIASKKITLARHTIQNFDKHGEPIAGAGVFVTPGNGLLLVLAAVGGLALLLIARRRRSRDLPEPFPAT